MCFDFEKTPLKIKNSIFWPKHARYGKNVSMQSCLIDKFYKFEFTHFIKKWIFFVLILIKHLRDYSDYNNKINNKIIIKIIMQNCLLEWGIQIFIQTFFDEIHIFRFNFQNYYSKSKMLFLTKIFETEKSHNGI